MIKQAIAILAATATGGAVAAELTLKDAYAGYFHVGAAIPARVFTKDEAPTLQLVASQFNSITAENEMKWHRMSPNPGEFRFEDPDRMVDFAKSNQMYVVGHTFFWHQGTPGWLMLGDDGKRVSREALLDRMRERVRSIAQRYGDRIHAWDVVNEAIDRDRLRNIEFRRIIGDDWVEQAFRIAQEELSPNVELIYNDFRLTDEDKRRTAIKIIEDLKAKGIRIDGVGEQGHWDLNKPSIDEIEKTILELAATGVKVHISELDIDVLPRHPSMFGGNADVKLRFQEDPKMNPYADGLPDEVQQQLAKRYADIFRLFLKHSDKIQRVTFWGPTDAHSWLNNWPVKGRTSHPLLFDRNDQPKPAFHAVINAAKEHRAALQSGE